MKSILEVLDLALLVMNKHHLEERRYEYSSILIAMLKLAVLLPHYIVGI